jgi:hypothetical protein
VENFRRSVAPSPEVFRGYRAELLQTPPKLLSPSQAERRRKKFRFTRIPDFAQLLFEIKLNMPGNMVDDLARYRVGPLLLVEIKKSKAGCQIYDFAEVLDQTDQQARNAFATYPVVNSLGLIVALGDCWTYREYEREDFASSPTVSECLDPTFGDPVPEKRPPSKICPVVHECFGALGFARLQEQSSDDALTAVRQRLLEFGRVMFY